MIRGYFGGYPGRMRPFVIANLAIPALAIEGTVHFLVDTGADSTLLSPRDATELGVDLSRLPQSTPSTGVGGRTPTVSIDATISLDTHISPSPCAFSPQPAEGNARLCNSFPPSWAETSSPSSPSSLNSAPIGSSSSNHTRPIHFASLSYFPHNGVDRIFGM